MSVYAAVGRTLAEPYVVRRLFMPCCPVHEPYHVVIPSRRDGSEILALKL